MSEFRRPHLAVIGCGAISESYYFPALAKIPALRRGLWIVDPSKPRREWAIRAFGFDPQLQAGDVSELPQTVTAAINATPNHLHVSTSEPLIERGVHLLVEKPLAETAADARRLVEAAAGRCRVGVNQFRRVRPINRYVRETLKSGQLGAIRRIVWREGHKFDWPTQSGFYFRRPSRGPPRGALLDIGVHALDLICWWLDAKPTVTRAVMDGHGGPEGYVSANLQAGSAEIELQVSFHAKMANQFIIEGERGTLRGSTLDAHKIELEAGGRRRQIVVGAGPDWVGIAGVIVGNFIEAATGRAELLVEAGSVVGVLDVIDEIYAQAETVLPSCYKEWVA